MEDLRVATTRRASGWWIGQGAISGLLAGAAFLAFEIAVAATTMGAAWALFPLRMIGGILLGRGALDPASPAPAAVAAGLLVHVTLSAAFGALFASMLQQGREPAAQRPIGVMLAASAAYGFTLWLVNFYVIAPLAGWPWFPRDTNPVIQFLAHAVVYGLFLGSYLDRVETGQRAGELADRPEAGVVDEGRHPRRERRRPAA
jgi:hypothetical protein